ncbi:hypothetical protein Bca4012_068120 [Brassica carinata]
MYLHSFTRGASPTIKGSSNSYAKRYSYGCSQNLSCSELGFIIGEIVIEMVVRGEVTTLKGFEEISSIIITEMLINISENLQKFKYSYDPKNTIKICLMSLELQIICYLTFSVE